MRTKKAVVTVLLVLLYLPITLSLFSKLSGVACDVPLLGYTDTVSRPEFVWPSFLNGDFQHNFSSWFETKFKPRGVITKTYAAIRYDFFRLGNRPVGYHGDIFEDGYIDAELCINGRPDFSKEEHQAEMQAYVNQLITLQKKLKAFDKLLYICITPSKADFHYENIPQKYKGIADEKSMKSVDCFSEMLKKTDLPYIICRDEKDNLEYPPFYNSGIHWSRTFEQKATAKMVEDLSEITGKRYRNILLGEAERSSTPYWRDADVYNLLNVWKKPEGTYYEYQQDRESCDNYDKMRFLIQGTSFTEGIRKTILDSYPYEDIYYINRDSFMLDKRLEMLIANTHEINGWDTLDISDCLNNVDAVIIESTEAELANYSYGFVDYLVDFLDRYEPGKGSGNYIANFHCGSDEAWHSDSLSGIYGREEWFAWTKDYCEIILDNPEIETQGLEIGLTLSPFLFDGESSIQIDAFVNGMKLSGNGYCEAGSEKILIAPQELEKANNDGRYHIELYCSGSFVPVEKGINNDVRQLSIQLEYVGSAHG